MDVWILNHSKLKESTGKFSKTYPGLLRTIQTKPWLLEAQLLALLRSEKYGAHQFWRNNKVEIDTM